MIDVLYSKLLSVDDFVHNRKLCPVPLSNTGVVGALNYIGNIGIDWLQVSFWGTPTPSGLFSVKMMQYSTKIFKSVAELFYNGELLGNMTFNPISPIIPSGTLIFKFENSILYKYDAVKLVLIIQKGLGLIYKGISRIDLFSDFNSFAYGLAPYNLISRFLSSEYLKIKNSKFDVRGRNGEKIDYEFLKFGSNTSDICCYLYNKSQEMKDVKLKPWIVERWKYLSLDLFRDVWRLEFSIKKCNFDVVSKLSGELNSMSLEFFDIYENINNLYYSLVDSYFSFCYNDGKSKKIRNKGLVLFVNKYEPVKLCEFTNKIDSKRANKIFVKHLHIYNNNLRGKSIMGDLERDNVLNDYLVLHDLVKWYNSKVKDVYV